MALVCGIVGLPNVGKSTLFNALLKKQAAVAANYPFTTIEPNVGVVEVPDVRMQQLAQLVANENSKPETLNSKQIQNSNIQNLNENRSNWPPIVPAIVRFVDIAGLVKGAHKGEGLGNQFLSHIREVDAIVFVIREFKNGDILETGSGIPQDDLAILEQELLLKDLEVIDKRIISFEKELKAKTADKKSENKKQVLESAKSLVSRGNWLASDLGDEEMAEIADLQLLSAKKRIVVINSDEADLAKDVPIDGAMRICAKLEEEIVSLDATEQKEYLKELGFAEPGLNRLIEKAYKTLGLITYFTAGPKEVRAWTIEEGTNAQKAAGVIHTDFEKGFISADVVAFSDLAESGSRQAARDVGKIRNVGRNELIKDGDVVEFKFSV